MAHSTHFDPSPIGQTGSESARSALPPRAARGIDTSTGKDGFFGCGNHLQLSGIGLSYCAHDSAVEARFDETAAVRQQFCLRGSASIVIGGRTFEARPDRSCVLNGNQPATVNFSAGYEQLVLKIEQEFLARKFEALTGRRPHTRFVFDQTLGLDTDAGRGLRRVVLTLAELFSVTGPGVPPMVVAELEQMAATALLSYNGHNFRRLLEADPLHAAPWQVRCVEDYIESHWNAAVTIEKLAQIANTSARSIFKAFQANRGYSPMAFAKQVRLRHARAMLSQPEAHTSVLGVAFACGFGNPGHFARDYRLAFGELPSATFNRTKGLRPA